MKLLPLLAPLPTRRTALLSAGTLGLLGVFGAAAPAAAAGLLGSGPERREARPVPAFDGVRLRGPFEVVLAQGPGSVEVRGDADLVPLVETRVVPDGERRVLEIALRDGTTLRNRGPLKVHASAPAWRSIAVDGSGDVDADGLTGESLAVSLVGSGDIRLRGLALQSVALSLSGSGDVRLAGSTRSLAVVLKGSGDVWAEDLQADEVDVSLSGSGDVRVQAARALRAAVAGSGDVTYRGAPSLQVSLSGSGRVTRR